MKTLRDAFHLPAHRRIILGAILAALSICLPEPRASAANGAVTYTYDALGRISTASYDTGVFIYYTYDANGNRLSQVVNVNSSILTWTATSTPCSSNCWGGALW
jgi:YD repeat-containing protein